MLLRIRLDQTMTCPAATTSRCATRPVGKQEDAYRPCSRTYDVKPRTRIGYYRCLCDTPTVLPKGDLTASQDQVNLAAAPEGMLHPRVAHHGHLPTKPTSLPGLAYPLVEEMLQHVCEGRPTKPI